MSDNEIVVYKRNPPEQVQERMDPELLKLIMLDDMRVIASKIQLQLEKETFEGELDSRTLASTDSRAVVDLIMNRPYTPWITASFFNDGPDTVYLCINRLVSPIELGNGESTSIDLAKGGRRIELIHYWCATGETASVRAVGKY